MTLFGVPLRLLTVATFALALSGCFPVDSGGGDEQKAPHFLAGKSRLNSMDFEGAITAFESALISNPKSASAHLELGLLYEEKKANYAAEIYHFERHLALKPKSKWTETVNQHIYSCKLELAKTVSFALVSRQVQDELRRLDMSNTVLLAQIQTLKTQLADQALEFSNKLALASQVSFPVPDLVEPREQPERRPTSAEPRSPAVQQRPSLSPQRTVPQPRFRSQPYPMAVPRSHIVRPGETLAGISKKYNVKLSALQKANPYVEPRRLKAGQVLNIPASGD